MLLLEELSDGSTPICEQGLPYLSKYGLHYIMECKISRCWLNTFHDVKYATRGDILSEKKHLLVIHYIM